MNVISKNVLNTQQEHWENTFLEPDAFGESPSYAGRKSLETMGRYGVSVMLELGAGQGRDTFLFARNGLDVTAGDYTKRGIDAIMEKAERLQVSEKVHGKCADVRKPLPFEDETFDACYSHMLLCMALEMTEIESLVKEIGRVLKPNGLCIFTVRNTSDPHYGAGIHHGEDMYEVDGFIVQFYDREKVERLARDYETLSVEEFQEGKMPRSLYLVTMRKKR